MSKTILKIENLHKSFFTLDGEIEVLHNLNLELEEGEKIALVGPSGCGKSTLYKMIKGTVEASEDSVFFSFSFPRRDGKIFLVCTVMTSSGIYQKIIIYYSINHSRLSNLIGRKQNAVFLNIV